jgi:hypothetical protein
VGAGRARAADLIEQQTAGPEHGALPHAALACYEVEFTRLRGLLEDAVVPSPLPDEPGAQPALRDLRLRLGGSAST